jgi:hypothetical protein
MSCCNQPFIPLGTPNCVTDFSVIRSIIFVDESKLTYGTNGLPNNLLTLIDDGYAVISPKVVNVVADKPESKFQEFEDGSKLFIRESQRSLTFIIARPTYAQIYAFQRLRCRKSSVYLVDRDGNLLGYTNEPQTLSLQYELKPIPIDRNTIDAILQFATDTTVTQLKITLQFELFREETLAITENFQTSILDLINNAPTQLFYRNLGVDTTQTEVTFRLYAFDNNFGALPINNDDFNTPPFTITMRNVSTAADVSLTITAITYNNSTQFLTLTYTGTGISAGHDVYLKKLNGIKAPFAKVPNNKDITTAT